MGCKGCKDATGKIHVHFTWAPELSPEEAQGSAPTFVGPFPLPEGRQDLPMAGGGPPIRGRVSGLLRLSETDLVWAKPVFVGPHPEQAVAIATRVRGYLTRAARTPTSPFPV